MANSLPVTTKRALVLAGGGLAGIAWETGVLRGIADESPDAARALLESDVLLGTSAGSTVAAQLGSGGRLDDAVRPSGRRRRRRARPRRSIDDITELFVNAMAEPEATTAEKLQHIGAVALSTETVAEPVRREVIAHRLPSHEWPDRVLRVTAIDIETGELVIFDRESGVGLVDAVAASCAVPGAWPPVTIGRRRFMDGGVGSTVNLSLPTTATSAVVLVPSGEYDTVTVRRRRGRRDRGLPRRDARLSSPTTTSLAAFGPNPLDPACRIPSANAGRAQGRREAAAVAGSWASDQLSSSGVSGSSKVRAPGGQFLTDLDDLVGAVEFQAAAGGAGHLDQQVGRIGRQGVPGQRRLGDVDGPVDHLETAEPGDRASFGCRSLLVASTSARPDQRRTG